MNQPDFNFSSNQEFYSGKVRDVYRIGQQIVMIASDRISAFDCILPKPIPFKGQVLNQLAAWFLHRTSGIVPNWLEAVPHPNVSIGKKCEPVLVEMVVRGYLAGHAARVYASGKREICGVQLPDGLKEGDRLPSPIITPTTKASSGHDMDISKEEILRQGIVTDDIYLKMENYSLALFEKGSLMAEEKGLILVDTKYEFGLYHGEVLLMDEVHTPDSSRYFYLDGYQERQDNGIKQMQLSKEFVREWLLSNGFSGQEGQTIPEMSDEFVSEISKRYIALFEKMTGEIFQAHVDTDFHQSVITAVSPHIKTTA
jgi:phosphoribosylaminoimidazole-succinocarboxamide synthase